MSSLIGQTASSPSSSDSDPPPPPHWNTSFFPGWNFDIFLSFRGKDTRLNFTDHLYTALVEKGIRTFRDDKELRKAQKIKQQLMQAIDKSKMFIIIFSENYANSQWCLNELVKIMECTGAGGRKVFPIFYHVAPSEVRHQSGKYETAFRDYENDAKLEREQIQKWKTALKEAGDLVGEHIENQHEAQMIKDITKQVICEIIGEQRNEDGLVGKKRRLEALKELINKRKRDVLMIGIHGPGEIGKTTIARALYDEISCQFEGASFLANIGDVSEEEVLYCLQHQLYCDILFGGENQEIRPFRKRNNVMKEKICCKKVLIVLDDVNNKKQLQILAGQRDWFGRGSRIVITAKSELLLRDAVDELYKHEELNPLEALRLFSHYANTQGESLHDFYLLSKEVINFCGHPLDLKVAGSFLRGKIPRQWNVQLCKLATENLDILKVSYNGLNDQEKETFLDVACFFKGEYEDFVTKMLYGHDSSGEDGHDTAKNGLKVLTDRCLITVSERKLWMESRIQKLGWQIARKPKNRLWDPESIKRLLRTKEGRVVEGISLDLSKSNQMHFYTDVFENMTELKLLKVFLGSDCVDGKEDYKVNLSTNFVLPGLVLRYLHWHGYQLEVYPSNFQPMELLELNMPYSRLKQINGNEIHFPKLIVLDLSHSQHLGNISNFSRMPNLERLVLEGCRSLVEVDESIGDLKKLSLMNLKDCKRLNSLPKSICQLECLKTLILVGCSRLEELPDDLKELQSLVKLKANGTSIRGITLPLKLRILHLRHCKRLRGFPVLPSSIQEVDVYNCISLVTLSWNTEPAASILPRIQIPNCEFSILLPGNTIPCRCFTHEVKGSSITMKLPNPDWYNDDFLGFAVCLVFAPKAEIPQLNPEILCELNNFTFFYSCGEDSVDESAESDQEWGNNSPDHVLFYSCGENSEDGSAESDQEWGNNSTDHVWLAYRARARADRCRPKEWNHIKASFEVFDCEVKKCAICLIYKSNDDGMGEIRII